MEISDAGLNLIKQSEGFQGTVYDDVAGFPTIGYGHKLTSGESFPDGITEEDATTLLLADVQSAENAVTRLVTVPLNQGQFDALTDFTYNLGSGNLQSSTLLSVLNAGQYNQVPAQLVRWVYAGKQVQPGLVTRRNAEVALWNSTPVADA